MRTGTYVANAGNSDRPPGTDAGRSGPMDAAAGGP